MSVFSGNLAQFQFLGFSSPSCHRCVSVRLLTEAPQIPAPRTPAARVTPPSHWLRFRQPHHPAVGSNLPTLDLSSPFPPHSNNGNERTTKIRANKAGICIIAFVLSQFTLVEGTSNYLTNFAPRTLIVSFLSIVRSRRLQAQTTQDSIFVSPSIDPYYPTHTHVPLHIPLQGYTEQSFATPWHRLLQLRRRCWVGSSRRCKRERTSPASLVV